MPHAHLSKRGRPLKFGRPSTLLAVKVPQDTIEALRAVDSDLGRAVVALASRQRQRRLGRQNVPVPPFQLVRLYSDHFVIVVDRTRLASLPGIAMVPVSDTGALLAFEGAGALLELELAIRDALDELNAGEERRRALEEARQQVRTWRIETGLHAEIRHLVVIRRVRVPRSGQGIPASRATRSIRSKVGAKG